MNSVDTSSITQGKTLILPDYANQKTPVKIWEAEIWEKTWYAFLHQVRNWKYWIYLSWEPKNDEHFEKKCLRKRESTFISFEFCENGKISLCWMHVPQHLRCEWLSDILLNFLFHFQRELWSESEISSYINKPLLSKKLMWWNFTPLQTDILAEICWFDEIPTIKFVRGNVDEILAYNDFSGRFHPPFYHYDADAKWTWMIVPIHTRFIPPDRDMIQDRLSERVSLSQATVRKIF